MAQAQHLDQPHWQDGRAGRPPLEFQGGTQEAERQAHVRAWIRELERHQVLRWGWQSRVPEQYPVSQGTVSKFYRGQNISPINVDRIIDVIERSTGAHWAANGQAFTDISTLNALIKLKEQLHDEANVNLAKARAHYNNMQRALEAAESKLEGAKQVMDKLDEELADLRGKWEQAYIQEQDRRADEDSEIAGQRVDVEPLDEETAYGSVVLSSAGRQPDKRRAPEQQVD